MFSDSWNYLENLNMLAYTRFVISQISTHIEAVDTIIITLG